MTVYHLYSEKTLLQKIAAGDESAFKHIFELYKTRLYSFVIKFIHSKADAEEIVQDIFLTLWQRRKDLTEIQHPRSYIYTMARHKVYHALSQAAKSAELRQQLWGLMQEENCNTDDLLHKKDSERLIQTALSHLSAQKQEIFELSREKGLSHEEIASQLQLSKSRVKNVIVETLKYLRQYLSSHQIHLFVYLIWELSRG